MLEYSLTLHGIIRQGLHCSTSQACIPAFVAFLLAHFTQSRYITHEEGRILHPPERIRKLIHLINCLAHSCHRSEVLTNPRRHLFEEWLAPFGGQSSSWCGKELEIQFAHEFMEAAIVSEASPLPREYKTTGLFRAVSYQPSTHDHFPLISSVPANCNYWPRFTQIVIKKLAGISPFF